VQRILDRAALLAGVDIGPRPDDGELQAADAARAERLRRLLLGALAAIGVEHQVAGEEVALRGDELAHVRAAHLLLPLEDELQVQRQFPDRLEQRLGRQDRDEHVALVVGRTTPVEASVADFRRERGRGPEP